MHARENIELFGLVRLYDHVLFRLRSERDRRNDAQRVATAR